VSPALSKKLEKLVGSEAIGLLGAAMLVGGIAYVWLGRLKDKTSAGDFVDSSVPAARQQRESHYHLKLGMPDPKLRSDNVGPDLAAENARADKSLSAANNHNKIEESADCPAAIANLDIAAKLLKIGDFEGVREIADLVIESGDATAQQKIQAQTLRRQCSPR
jgi:Tfp pilus assembly protein FimV